MKQDLFELNISLTFDEIKDLSHEQCKQLVKARCRLTAFPKLMEAKWNHNKMSALTYEELRIQPYFIDKTFHSGDAKLLFSFRTRMVNVRNNYKSSQSDIYCPLCDLEIDSQEHLLVCSKLHESPPNVSYSAIYQNDKSEMKVTFDALKRSLNLRNEFSNDRTE